MLDAFCTSGQVHLQKRPPIFSSGDEGSLFFLLQPFTPRKFLGRRKPARDRMTFACAIVVEPDTSQTSCAGHRRWDLRCPDEYGRPFPVGSVCVNISPRERSFVALPTLAIMERVLIGTPPSMRLPRARFCDVSGSTTIAQRTSFDLLGQVSFDPRNCGGS